jgi:heme exporter protein A
MGSATALTLDDLACAAGPLTLFQGLCLSLNAGQWASLRGHNGSGKSTLLRSVAGLSRPLNGSVTRHGDLLYQSHASGWKDMFNARENLAWQGMLEAGVKPSDNQLTLVLQRVGLSSKALLNFSRLSAGQKRRLSMARLLLSQAPIWLLDEPTTALDQQGQSVFTEMLTEHLGRGGLALIATHSEFVGLQPDCIVDLGGS